METTNGPSSFESASASSTARASGILGEDPYRTIRSATVGLTSHLSEEDCVVQSMPDASPAKWHLAHTTWFFETFVLTQAAEGYRAFHPDYGFLFNSYYNSVGPMHPRPARGLLTRPKLSEVSDYREYVDDRMLRELAKNDAGNLVALRDVVELGVHHEQQHQELILTDVKHAFSCNPLKPAYREHALPCGARTVPLEWIAFPEGIRHIGHEGDGFAFDNEGPRHRVFAEAFELASRPTTNGEFIAFIEDGGYRNPDLWLAEGWQIVNERGLTAPEYWTRGTDDWMVFTLGGLGVVDRTAPVCHVSFYESQAFARWSGARLPTEAEWEIASAGLPIEGNFSDSGDFHPLAAGHEEAFAAVLEPSAKRPARPVQMYGDVWEWTSSPYIQYPGYQPPKGALGEYNGKFMSNQMVLRGGSCATPRSHMRSSYRNFFPADARWQFSGFRLARDATA